MLQPASSTLIEAISVGITTHNYMYVHASRALSDNTCLVKDRLVVLESTFAGLGLGLELKGLGLGLATYGLGLGSFFSKSFFKSTLQSAPVERVFSHGVIVLLYFAISRSSTVKCCT